jgi:hypothetical protein
MIQIDPMVAIRGATYSVSDDAVAGGGGPSAGPLKNAAA